MTASSTHPAPGKEMAQAALAALRRAGARAAREAQAANTPIVITEGGQLRRVQVADCTGTQAAAEKDVSDTLLAQPQGLTEPK